MHPNPTFRTAPAAQNLAFARDRAFGTLALNDVAGPLLAHIPFLLSDAGDEAEFHLVRSNPIAARLADGGPAVIAVTGPDGYVSPDWYGMEDQVPTWNYVAVHLRGRLEPLPASALPDLLARQSAAFEARLAPKPAWTLDKVPDDHAARLMRMIVPARLIIETVDGTWKLGQNKPAEARLAAADAMPSGFGQNLATLSAMMRAAGDDSAE